MKTSTKYISLVLAASTAGVALFTLANASFTAFFQTDVADAVAASLAIVGFAAHDYSRRTLSLTVKSASILRPSPVVMGKTVKTTAYGLKSSRIDRIAA